MEPQTSVKTQGLGKVYTEYRGFLRKKTVKALNKVSFEVKRGEIFGMLGLNAAGKTTLLKMLLGFISPSWGDFEILGKRGIGAEVKKKIGYLPEEPKLYDFFTAEEFLLFCANMFKLNKTQAAARAHHLLNMLRIHHAASQRIKGFSKGMNQRLAIASSLINQPELLFLDEPLSGLDPVGRKLVKGVILDIKKEGRTVFFSSHILAEVEQICDRVGILHNGKLLCIKDTDTILRSCSLEDFFLHTIDTAKPHR